MDAEPTAVIQAIAAVMAELPAIGKNDKSPEGYSYRGVEQVTKHLQPLLAKHKLVIVPSATVTEVKPSPAMKEGWTDVFMSVDWRVYGPDGSSIAARTNGIGRDRADKGANKAQTQAFKYLLLHLFSIADKADDADGQTYEHDRAETEPPASDTARDEASVRISNLSEADKHKVAAWFAEHKVPSLKRPGATLTQLNDLADYITQLTTEPFKVGGVVDRDKAVVVGEGSFDDVRPPFSPVVFNPETGEQEPVAPNPAAAARKQLSATERKALDSAMRA